MSEIARRIKASRKQEKDGAAAHGGKRVGGSGAAWSHKGDAITQHELIEYKMTENRKSITIKCDDLNKIWEEAVMRDRIPVLGFLLNKKNYVILHRDDYIAMKEDLDGTYT